MGAAFVRRREEPASGWGAALKESVLQPRLEPWKIYSGFMGETIPKEISRVSLHTEKKD